MFVIYHDTLYAFKRHNDEIINILETSACLLASMNHLQIKFKTFC